MHLLTDTRIITKIKDNFIKSTIMDEFQLKMNEIQKATLGGESYEN